METAATDTAEVAADTVIDERAFRLEGVRGADTVTAAFVSSERREN